MESECLTVANQSIYWLAIKSPEMTLQDLEFLYDLKREGIKLGLEVMREFSSKLGDRHREFGSFHVAGTNGKGSVSCFI